MAKRKLYFGHPVNTYNTALEKTLLASIRAHPLFVHWDVENPNTVRHQEGYKAYVLAPGKTGMDYFYEHVLPSCAGGIFLPFGDGAWGAGVFGEANFLSERNVPIWKITTGGVVAPVTDLSRERSLSIDETRSRLYGPKKIIKPYA